MSYSPNQQKAWDHLTSNEQMALQLTIVGQRSKQEAAIIMGLAPYKFNELVLRARKFFLLFTEYYEEYEDFTPTELGISVEASLFLDGILLRRFKPTDLTSKDIKLQSLVRYEAKQDFWREFLTSLQKLPGQGQALYALLLEFDKWNSFRILPKVYQLPSPFSRRRIKQFKKIKEQLHNVTELGWELLLKEYSTPKPPFAFLPTFRLGQPSVETVRLSRASLKYFTSNQLPLFSTESRARGHIDLLSDYGALQKKSPHSSQKFWAAYRITLAGAVNYNELLNIQPGDLADLSAKDRKFIKQAQKQYKERTAQIKPTATGEFWQKS